MTKDAKWPTVCAILHPISGMSSDSIWVHEIILMKGCCMGPVERAIPLLPVIMWIIIALMRYIWDTRNIPSKNIGKVGFIFKDCHKEMTVAHDHKSDRNRGISMKSVKEMALVKRVYLICFRQNMGI